MQSDSQNLSANSSDSLKTTTTELHPDAKKHRFIEDLKRFEIVDGTNISEFTQRRQAFKDDIIKLQKYNSGDTFIKTSGIIVFFLSIIAAGSIGWLLGWSLKAQSLSVLVILIFYTIFAFLFQKNPFPDKTISERLFEMNREAELFGNDEEKKIIRIASNDESDFYTTAELNELREGRKEQLKKYIPFGK